jgi:hypothetical protein
MTYEKKFLFYFIIFSGTIGDNHIRHANCKFDKSSSINTENTPVISEPPKLVR